jgi:ABC-type branched-subunit amino acid transport system permease subunit
MSAGADPADAAARPHGPGSRLRAEDAAAAAVFAILALIPAFISGYVVFILPQYMLFGVLAMSLAILWGKAGIVSFGQAAFFAIGAYAMGLVMKHASLPVNAAYAGILVGAAAACLMALITGYFLFTAGVRATYFVVATLALSIMVEQTAKTFSDLTGGWNGLYVDRLTLTLGSAVELSMFDDVPIYYLVLGIVVPLYAAVVAVMRSRFGKIVVGIRENEDRMVALGFNVPLYKTLVFGLSGLLAGIAGALYATHAQFAHPSNAGVLFSTEIVIWTAIGGRHSLLGAFVGGVVVASLSNYLNSVTPQYWLLVEGIIFIAVVMLFRGGLAGLAETMARSWRSARARNVGATRH